MVGVFDVLERRLDPVGILIAQAPYFDSFDLDQGPQMARPAIAQPDDSHPHGVQFGCRIAGHIEALPMRSGITLMDLQQVLLLDPVYCRPFIGTIHTRSFPR